VFENNALLSDLPGIASRTNIDNSTTVQCSSQFNKLCKLARNCIRELDPENDLTFLRVRTKKNEVMCAAGKGRKYMYDYNF
jgi:dynein light chain roadblock-type